MPWFVWVAGFRGPEPQIVRAELLNPEGEQSGPKIIQKHKIEEADVDVGVSFLAEVYPFVGGKDA